MYKPATPPDEPFDVAFVLGAGGGLASVLVVLWGGALFGLAYGAVTLWGISPWLTLGAAIALTVFVVGIRYMAVRPFILYIRQNRAEQDIERDRIAQIERTKALDALADADDIESGDDV